MAQHKTLSKQLVNEPDAEQQMNTAQIIDELERIRVQVYRLRLKTKSAAWFAHILKAIEALINSAKSAVQHIQKLRQ